MINVALEYGLLKVNEVFGGFSEGWVVSGVKIGIVFYQGLGE